MTLLAEFRALAEAILEEFRKTREVLEEIRDAQTGRKQKPTGGSSITARVAKP